MSIPANSSSGGSSIRARATETTEFAAPQAPRDDGLQALGRVAREQLQHADVVPRAHAGAQALRQRLTQSCKRCRQLPVAVHRGVIQCPRLTFQSAQEMKRIEHFMTALIGTRVGGNGGSLADHTDAVDVPLDRDASERPPTWHAVLIAIEPHRLILVHTRRFDHTRIECVTRQWQRRREVVFEPRAH